MEASNMNNDIVNKPKDNKKKKIINVIVRAFSFLLMISLIYCYICYIFVGKTADDNTGTKCRGFVGEDQNTVEVLCLGSSFTANGIIPSVLYSEYGISSFNSSVYWVKSDFELGLYDECIQYQTPKLLIVDTEMLFDGGQNSPSDSSNSFLASPFTNHSRFSKLNANDFIIQDLSLNEDHFSKLKGYTCRSMTRSFDSWGINKETDLSYSLTSEQEILLNSFVNKVIKNGTSILFITTPCQYMKVYPHVSVHNYFKAFVKNNVQLSYLDFNDRASNDDTGIDANTDFALLHHLNALGAQKLSISLGKYLHNNYSLTDYRTLDDQNSKMEYSLTYIEEFFKENKIKQLF